MLTTFCWAVPPLMPPTVVPKASQKIIDKAKAGLAQELIVEFDHSEITEKINRKRLSAGAIYDRAEDTAEKQKQYALLRTQIFPNGRLGDAQVVTEYKNLPMALVHVPNAQALDKLLSHKNVAAISENFALYPALAQSLPLIGQPTAIANGKIGAGTKVAILDTGVAWGTSIFATDPNTQNAGCLQYFTGASLVGTADCKISEIISFGPTNDSGPFPGDPTMVAHGTLAADIVASIAPGAKIAVLQVMYKSTTGPTTSVAIVNKAIDWVISNAETSNPKIVAMNLSFGTTLPYETSTCGGSKFSTAFLAARAKGVLPVVASGNEGNKTQLPEPACALGAVSVGAVYDSNQGAFTWGTVPCTDPTTAANMVGCGSNSNPTLTLLAPGVVINGHKYGGYGTSQAAPMVAGAIAVLRAPNAFPNETPDGTVNRMRSSGMPVKDTRNGITTPSLNLAAALLYVPGPLSSPYIPTVQAIINEFLLNGE